MIKIEIENRLDKEQEYIDYVLDVVLVRINNLKISIDHLLGLPIGFNGVNFKSLRTVTKSIINLVELNNNINLNGKVNYTATLTNYINNPNNLGNINLLGISNLLLYLTNNNNENLKELLKCRPEQLSNLSINLLNDNGIVNQIDLKVLKLSFNYDNYKEVSAQIKSFFRAKNFVKFCPYCNYAEVEYIENPSGLVGAVHHLDHFFDKDRLPLLSYSMYNLVPSDYNCNSTNKGTIPFTNDFHLNPYIEGFGSTMNFIPIQLGSKINVETISIKINVNRGSRKYNQLIGDNSFVEEADENGNINVFKLLTRYRGRTAKAEIILECLQKTDKGINAIAKFMRLLNPNNKNVYYLEWYRKQIRTPFKYCEFNDEAFSKFNRDIHDYYYSLNPSNTNRHIRELIEANNT